MLKRARFLYLLTTLLLIMSLSVSGCGKEQEVTKETEITVTVDKATKRDIAKTVKYSGVVRGKNEVYVMPKVPARVTAILVKPGEPVSKGQTLITLDTKDFEAGARQAEAAVNAAQVQLSNAKTNYDRMLKLHEAGAVSDADLENAKTALNSAQVGLEQAYAALDQTGLDNCVITSPINGVVGSINLSLGETANPQSPAAIVTDTDELEIEVMVSESEITYVEEGSEVEIRIKAVSDKSFKGKVVSVAAVPDPVKRNYPVKIAFDNTGKIKSGMFAEVSVSTLSKKNAVCVPASAVVPKGARTVVFTVDEENRSREREVKLGIENSHYVEIVEGIKEGEAVITKGSTLVNDGTLVRVVTGGVK